MYHKIIIKRLLTQDYYQKIINTRLLTQDY